MQYFYDNQIRKYLQQLVRIFSDFVVDVGKDVNGNPIYRTVPVSYGDVSRMASHILKNNSENVINTTPFMSLYITNFDMAPDRRTYAQYNSTARVTEKKYEDGVYVNEVGNSYDVVRHNPVPYNITVNLDIWTSNTDQKLQLVEQICVLYNPDINLRTNNNPLDWSALTYMLMNNINWTGRSIPSGADEVIDITTLSFTIPIYLNPPAKVKKQTLIHTIINKLDVVNDENLKYFDLKKPFESQYTAYTIITLENYKLEFSKNNKAKLLSRSGGNTDTNGELLDWSKILPLYGNLVEGFSQLRLRRSSDVEDGSEDIIGTIFLDNDDPQSLIIDLIPETIPSNTLGTINMVVDTSINFPGNGILPNAVLNQKYLILYDINSSGAWGLNASKNDIISYNGSEWVIFFNSKNNNTTQRVFDINTQEQYEWDGSIWKKSYTGIYFPGYWRLYL
jgi:hypothetical protein